MEVYTSLIAILLALQGQLAILQAQQPAIMAAPTMAKEEPVKTLEEQKEAIRIEAREATTKYLTPKEVSTLQQSVNGQKAIERHRASLTRDDEGNYQFPRVLFGIYLKAKYQ